MKWLERPREMGLAIFAIWLALTLLALLGRHATTIDETRYLSAAWEMWQRGDLLVPYLNGEPYPHKPPLFFWLIHLSWALFGVSEWAARLVPALAGLAGALLAMPLAVRLWPGKPRLATLSAWMLFSTGFWLLWTTAVMFDLLVAVCAEIALLGVLVAWREARWGGWLLAGFGIGLGILAKGPVIFLYVLPVALLAPVWMVEQRPGSWLRWYGGVFGALLLGAVIGLSWALPAAIAGGEHYANRILWGQTAGRVVDSFAHQRPFWWYLPLLLPLLYPWSLWPPLWCGVRVRLSAGWESGERFSLLIFAVGLGSFSLVSGKQTHYLLPLFPFLALCAARALEETEARYPGFRLLALPLAPPIGLGLLLLALPHIPGAGEQAAWVARLSPLGGSLILLAAGVSLLLARRFPPTLWPGLVSVLLLAASVPGILREVARNYEVDAVGQLIGEAQQAGHSVAVFGKYHGEFNFAGRLTRPVEEIERDGFETWKGRHPDGLLVLRSDSPPRGDTGVRYWQPYRKRYLVLRDALSWRPGDDSPKL